MKFIFETRADLFSNEIAKLLSQTGLKFVWLGGESGSPDILKRLRGKDKGNGKEHILNLKNALKIAKKYNFLTGSSWIIGLPGENKKTMKETKNIILDLTKAGMDIADIRILQIFPGTSYWENPDHWGLKLIKKDITCQDSPWDKYAGHNTEFLSSEEIVEGANKINKELFQYYMEMIKSEMYLKKLITIYQ